MEAGAVVALVEKQLSFEQTSVVVPVIPANGMPGIELNEVGITDGCTVGVCGVGHTRSLAEATDFYRGAAALELLLGLHPGLQHFGEGNRRRVVPALDGCEPQLTRVDVLLSRLHPFGH